MSDLKALLSKEQEVLEKGITAAQVSETANSATVRPPLDLVPFMTDISRRSTPIVDMLLPRAKKGTGKAHVFNKMTTPASGTINLFDAFYADGNLPQETTTQYAQVAAPFKSLGYSGSVTGLAQAQGGDLFDLYANEVERKAALVMEALEFTILHGSTSVASPGTSQTQFAGLDELVTQTVDAGGVKLSGTGGKEIIDEAANKIGQQGGEATHMFTSYRTAQNVNNTYNNNSSTQVIKTGSGDNNITWGELVPQVQTSAGLWKVVGNFFVNPGNNYKLPNDAASTPSGATTSTAYIVNMDYMNLVNLESLMLEPLGTRTDKKEFFVRIYTVLELLASEYCVRITNIDDTLS